jgi:hypothetical protein
MNMLPGLFSAFGLSTAAGLNAYIPLLVIGLMSRFTNLIELSAPYDILEHPITLVVIALIALLDFIGDKIPAVDHALHTVGVAIHPIAGALAFMAANSGAGDVNPILSAICGIVLAGGAHLTRTTARPVATATTAGVANPFVSLIEDVMALLVSVLAIVIPIVAFIVVLVLAIVMIMVIRRISRRLRRKQAAPH